MKSDLDKEIERINKMHIPAGERMYMVKRAKSTFDCNFRSTLRTDNWCLDCGYYIEDHKKA